MTTTEWDKYVCMLNGANARKRGKRRTSNRTGQKGNFGMCVSGEEKKKRAKGRRVKEQYGQAIWRKEIWERVLRILKHIIVVQFE